MSGNLSQSVSTLREVLRLDPTLAQAHKDLGDSLRELAMQSQTAGNAAAPPADACARFADDIDELKVAIQWAAIQRSKDDEAQAQLDLSKTHLACGNLELAKSQMAQSIASKPGYSDAVAALQELESQGATAK